MIHYNLFTQIFSSELFIIRKMFKTYSVSKRISYDGQTFFLGKDVLEISR